MSDEIKVNSELPQKLATLGQVKDALGKRDKKIDSLKKDISTKITKFYKSNQGETHITDSDNGKIQDMMIYGRSSQSTTTGKNLLKYPYTTADGMAQGIIFTDNKDGSISVSGTATGVAYYNLYSNIDGKYLTIASGTYKLVVKGRNKCNVIASNSISTATNEGTFTITDGHNEIYCYITVQEGLTVDETIYPMIQLASITDESYEPYTGGIPSPSPDYPQEIKSVVNPTVKVTNEDGLKVQSVTLNNITLNAIPVSSGGNVTIGEQQYISDYVDVEKEKLYRKVKRLNLKDVDDTRISFGFHSNENGYLSISTIENINKEQQPISNQYKSSAWTDKSGYVYIPSDNSIVFVDDRFTDRQTAIKLVQDTYAIYALSSQTEEDLSLEQIKSLKSLSTYYPTTNISVNSEQLDGYTVFNYPIPFEDEWNKTQKEIGGLKEELTGLDTKLSPVFNDYYTIRTVDISTEIQEGYYGDDVTFSPHDNYRSIKHVCSSGEKYYISTYLLIASKQAVVTFYDKNNTIIARYGGYYDGQTEDRYFKDYECVAPTGSVYFITNSFYVESYPLTLKKLELKKQKTDADNTESLGNGYVPMHFTISNGIWSDGTIIPNENYKAIVFTCGGNENYSIDTYMNGDAKMPVARFLNSAGTEIGTTDAIIETGPLYQYKIVTPEDCTKMIVNGYLQPSDWPYAIRKYIPEHLPLAEKNVVFLGDSIMYGLSNTAYTGGWRDWFCRFTGATQIMCTAVSGATICDYDDTILNGNPLDTEHSNTLSNQVQSIINSPPSNPDFVDYILIFAGTNDHAILSEFQGGVTQFIDTATNSYIDIDTIDRTRYDGAMRWVTEKLCGIFSRAKIYWITPIQGAEPVRQTRLQIMKSDYMQEIATWLACPVIDATRNSGIYGRYENEDAIGKYLFDGLHPTGEGYKLLGEFIAKEVASRESY